ncbi:hypothetical protein EDC04DRAFT_3141009 [Pisolithus marmoratus]|nr:hypothetical protein EDC04DRAFT_3141009 [Pisolithus marmoratus]
MDYLPELAHNGHNWTTYASSVLCAITAEGLMGFLVGSETRPIHPAELEGRSEGWTPQTDDERDAVTAWQTADQLWTQWNATVNYTIICGIPDTIFGLMLHLKSPLEKWDYLEQRFGSIPRPDSWLAAEEAMRQCKTQHELSVAGETAQCAGDSHDEPNTLTEEESSSDGPNDCAETKTGHLTPEFEVVDVRHMEDNLPVVETGTSDAEQPDKCTNTLKAPDEDSRHMDKAVASRDSPELSSKAHKTAGDTTKWARKRSIDNGSQTPVECIEHVKANGETIANIPDPPGMHAECPTPYVECSMLQDKSSTRDHSATSTELRFLCMRGQHASRQGKQQLSVRTRPLSTPSNLSYWTWPPDFNTQQDMGPMADSKGQDTEREAKRQDGLPALPEPPPDSLAHPPGTLRDPHRRGRLKTSAETVSNVHTRRSAHRAHAAPMQPLRLLSKPTKRSKIVAGGPSILAVRDNEVSDARIAQTRGHTHRTAGIYMQLPQALSSPSKRLWNIANTYWRQWEPPGSMQNDAKRPRSLPMAKQLPRSSGKRGDDTHTSIHSPAPHKRPPDGLTHTPRTLRDHHRRGRIKTEAENVSIVRTRPSAYRTLVVAIWPLRLISTPTNPFKIVAGGSTTLSVRYNEVSGARTVQTRGHTHPGEPTQGCATIQPSRGPRKRRKPPWGVPDTYHRQGVPPRRTRSDGDPSDSQNGGLTITVQGRSAHTTMHFRNGKLPHRAPNTTKHHSYTTRTRSSLIAEATLVY